MSGESVRVAIRVRPYNSREKAEGAELCVEMKGKMTKVWNKETNYEKEFFFDYSYWSHDGFTEEAGGLLVKDSPHSIYADQQTVFEDLGNDVLNNAWNGYHACLFAYGQTGSGKSYSMVGYGANKGIVPIACEEIFNRISADNNPNVKYDVKVSMLEIYNEQVQDLLTPPAKRVKGGLKIRENPKTGVYVEGIVTTPVSSYDEINNVFESGTKNRTVGATQMNATSSRAHTVLTISFTQIFYEEGTGKPLNRKQSDINLVDLAGSERAAKTGASGDRLQEGSNINKSLSTLGKVITALAKKSAGKAAKGEVVPYRESKLTRILQNALGGNSKTTMIAAISPATFNFDETLSTLRYADAVKAIKNQAIVNETPQEKLIRELREENERLKSMLDGKGGGAPIDDDTRREFESQIEELRRAKEEAEKTFQEKLRDAEVARANIAAAEPVKKEVTGPHLMNINEDPQLTGHIKHEIPEGVTRVGRVGSNQIILQGLGIAENHCQLTHSGGAISLVPSSDASGKTMINGHIVSKTTQLNHGDRLRFGNYLYFMFVDPRVSAQPEVDWHAAVSEANESEMKSMMGEKEEELKRKEAEMQKKMQAEWEVAQRQIEEEKKKLASLLEAKQKQDADSLKALADREAALLAKQREMEEELKRKELELKQKEKERQTRSRLEQMISNSLQMSNEANERASMLGKSLRLRPEFNRKQNPDGSLATGPDSINMRYRLMLPGLNDVRLYWGSSVLEERLPDMADMCQQYFEGTPLEEIDIGYDPFSIDPNSIENMLDLDGNIGQVNLITETLFYLMEIAEEPHPIYNPQGQQVGSLIASIYPRLEGVVIEEEDYESMKDIEGQTLYLDIMIKGARNLPATLSKDVYCSYSFPFAGREVFNSQRASGENAVFNYRNEHSFVVTRLSSNEVEKGQLTINVFGSKPESMRQQEINTVRKALGLAPTNAAISSSSLSIDNKKSSTAVNKASDLHIGHEEKKSFDASPAKSRESDSIPAKKVSQESSLAASSSSRPVASTSHSSLPVPQSSQPDTKKEDASGFKSNPSVYSLDPQAVPKSDAPGPKNTATVVPATVEIKSSEPAKVEAAQAPEAKKSSCCVII
jgi:pSer/pThr/pTyr-binding forkhead associated (FHA) protein